MTLSTPVPPPRPDPTTPGLQPKPTAFTAAITTVTAGTPAAVAFVWWLSTYGHVTDPVAASAIGAAIASAAGYVWRVVQALLTKAGINPGPNP